MAYKELLPIITVALAIAARVVLVHAQTITWRDIRGELVFTTVNETTNQWLVIDVSGDMTPLMGGYKPPERDNRGARVLPGSVVQLGCNYNSLSGECTPTSSTTLTVIIPAVTGSLAPGTTVSMSLLVIILDYSSCSYPAGITEDQISNLYMGPGGVAEKYSQCSYGKFTINPSLFRVIRVQSACSVPVISSCAWWAISSAADGAAKAALGLQTFSQYMYTTYVLPPGIQSNCRWAGLALLPGSKTWMQTSSYGISRWATIMQEAIHNFGVWHSWRNGIEYEDYSTCMGRGDVCPNSVELSRMGWATPASRGSDLDGMMLLVGTPVSFDLPATYLTGTGSYVRVLPNWLTGIYSDVSRAKNLFISVRVAKNADVLLGPDFASKVNIHELNATVDNGYPNSYPNTDAMIQFIGSVGANSQLILGNYMLVVYGGSWVGLDIMRVSLCRYQNTPTECRGPVPSPNPSPTSSPPRPSSPKRLSPPPPPPPISKPPPPPISKPPPPPISKPPPPPKQSLTLSPPPPRRPPPPRPKPPPPPSPPPPSPLPPSPPPPSPLPPSPPLPSLPPPIPAVPYSNPADAGFYIGCFRDDGGRRIPDLLDYTSMTPGRCASIARARGYTLYGLQFENECYAGNDLSRALSLGPSGECRMPCSGDSSKMCGGNWANNVYSLTCPPVPGYTAVDNTDTTGGDEIMCDESTSIETAAMLCSADTECASFTLFMDLDSGIINACTKRTSRPTSPMVGTCLYKKIMTSCITVPGFLLTPGADRAGNDINCAQLPSARFGARACRTSTNCKGFNMFISSNGQSRSCTKSAVLPLNNTDGVCFYTKISNACSEVPGFRLLMDSRHEGEDVLCQDLSLTDAVDRCISNNDCRAFSAMWNSDRGVLEVCFRDEDTPTTAEPGSCVYTKE